MKKTIIALLCMLLSGSALFAQNAAQREIKVNQRYLNIPVYDDRPSKVLTFSAKGVEPLEVDVWIAQGEPEYWVFKDLTPYMGKTLKLTYEGDAADLDKLFVADTIVGQSNFYKEAMRPQFHFTTLRGWTNDPNGMVYSDGEYHLYYQHNPYNRHWGNMHWGHAVSRDLVHWEELGDVLFPDEMGTMFSGSAVVDVNNTSGFGSKKNPPIVYAYTTHGQWQKQNIAYSTDRGRTLIKYKGNPVVDSHEFARSHETRDPRLLWYGGKDGHWVMALFERDGNSIYTSDDLKTWTYQSHITGFDECPDLFCLPVDGDKNNMKWVTLGAAGTYMIGDFDGYKFTPEAGKFNYTVGGFYAAQTFSNTPDGRCIQIGWGRIGHPGMPFNSQMCLPTELTLRTTKDGVRLNSFPVLEVKTLLNRKYTSEKEMTAAEANAALKQFSDPKQCLHIRAKYRMLNASGSNFCMNDKPIVDVSASFDLLNGRFYSPQKFGQLEYEFDLYLDRTSVEVFMEGGLYNWCAEVVCNAPERKFEFGGEVVVTELIVDTIDSIW